MNMKAAILYLRTLREKQKLTQEDIAKLAGVKKKQVYRWEAGHSRANSEGFSAYVDAVNASARHMQYLMQLPENPASEEVAVTFAEDRLRELNSPRGSIDSQRQQAEVLIDQLLAHPKKFDRWVGFGEGLLAGLHDNIAELRVLPSVPHDGISSN
jgi:transcriptional regulator with XRE-family HTH domain